MESNIDSVWQRLEALNVSKAFVLFTAKRTAKKPDLELIVQSIIVTTKCGNNSIDWEDDIYKFDSPMVRPIREECADLQGKMDGMLTYDNVARKITLSATVTRKVKEKIKKNL